MGKRGSRIVKTPSEQVILKFIARFRGSENQRLIDVPKSLETGTVVLWEDWQGEKKGMK